jgi:phage gp29-like protein
MPDLFQRVKTFGLEIADRLIPTKKDTVVNARWEENAVARRVDVDRVHNIIEAAENGDTTDLFSLYRDVIMSDAHIQTEFAKRKLSVLGDPLVIIPYDKTDPLDKAAAEAVDQMLGDVPHFIRACASLLDSTLYPVSICEKVFCISSRPGIRYDLQELVHVPHRLMDFTGGTLRIHKTDDQGMRLTDTIDADPSRYITHRGHLLTFPDNWGGPMRSIIFWWLLSVMDRDWWARALERFGAPFIVARYDQSDDKTRSKLEIALSMATRLFGVVVTKETEIELKEAASSQSGDAFDKFHTVCQREKSKLILGQTLSSEAQATGLGSGVAKGQSDVRNDIRQFDATILGQTLRDQLLKQWLAINGIPGRAPRITWASEHVDIDGSLLGNLASAGLQVTDSGIETLSDRLGFELTRSAAPIPATTPQAFAAGSNIPRRVDRAEQANDTIAAETSASLARAFRGSLAPIRRIILESQTPQECEARIREFYADWSPARVAPIIEEALIAHAANGSTVNAR